MKFFTPPPPHRPIDGRVDRPITVPTDSSGADRGRSEEREESIVVFFLKRQRSLVD